MKMINIKFDGKYFYTDVPGVWNNLMGNENFVLETEKNKDDIVAKLCGMPLKIIKEKLN